MARITTTMTPANIDAALRDLAVEFAGLEELAALWHTFSNDQRIDYGVEWYDLMGQFEALEQLARTRALSTLQDQRYRAILSKCSDVRRIVQQIDLALPAVTLADRD